MEKKLYKSDKNKVFAGICGGIAEYFNCDPTLIRVIAVVIALMDGLGILAYLILCIVVPSRDSSSHNSSSSYSRPGKKHEDSEFDSYFKD